MLKKYRWLLVFVVAVVTAGAGLYIGKTKEKDYLAKMYARKDFTLLDAEGNLFQLSKFPKDKLLLLVFTPDGIRPGLVKPFAVFSRKLGELKKLDVETKLITRTNREIARNFKEATGFPYTLLLDTSGTVGRIVGVWPSTNPVSTWGYALIDNELRLYWAKAEGRPLTYEELLGELKKLSQTIAKPTSSESP